MSKIYRSLTVFFTVFLITAGLFYIVWSQKFATAKYQQVEQNNRIKIMTKIELRQYDGTDPSRPIYLALDGKVYDVTQGKEFYQKGGPYHNLAGKDSSIKLHIAGGEIIKRKYPVIAKLVD